MKAEKVKNPAVKMQTNPRSEKEAPAFGDLLGPPIY